MTHPGQRYSLDTINRNPLRGYPPATVLYGMETDSTLLADPAFTAPNEAGRDKDRPFIRGARDPAALALEAVGAIRVPAEEIEMCTWGAGAQRIEIARPFRDQTEMFRAYRLPPRSVADGATKHAWSQCYGAMEQHGGGVEAASLTARVTESQLARTPSDPAGPSAGRITM